MGASRRVEAYIDGIALTQAVPGAIIRQITEDVPQVEQSTMNVPGLGGQRIIGVYRRSRKISVEFVLRQIHNLSARAMMQEDAAAWAHDGVLTVSYRTDRQIRVRCTACPVIGAARDYTQVLKAEFTAPLPWWEDAVPATLTLAAGTEGEGSFSLPGSALTPVDAEITAGSGGLDEILINCRETSLAFENLGLDEGDVLKIGHSDEGWLTVTCNGADMLPCMTIDSDDGLLAMPAFANEVSYEADKICTVKLIARGRYA